jgi:hypothetical protein
MGVALGVAVLLLCVGLVVLMAASEWYDLDFNRVFSQGLGAPSRPSKGAKRRRR